MTQRLTRRQAAILGVYTAHILGPYSDSVEYVRTLPGFANVDERSLVTLKNAIRTASKADVMAMVATAEDPLEEPVESLKNNDQIVNRFSSLLHNLHKRFPKIAANPSDWDEDVEVDYLAAIDKLLKPVPLSVKAEQFVGAVQQEELFFQAIASLRPPDDQRDPHRNRVRKVLDSVVAAYEKLKQSKQIQEALGASEVIPVSSVEEGLALYTERQAAIHAAHAEKKDEQS